MSKNKNGRTIWLLDPPAFDGSGKGDPEPGCGCGENCNRASNDPCPIDRLEFLADELDVKPADLIALTIPGVDDANADLRKVLTAMWAKLGFDASWYLIRCMV